MDQQTSTQPGPKTGVHVPEGAGKDYKGPQKSPPKAQARMLRMSRRTSDSDDDIVYEKAAAFLVRPRDEYNQLGRAPGASMVHEEDSPFSMDKIRTSIPDSEPEPGRERANLIRVKLEPKMEEDQPGLIKSDPIATNVEAEELESKKRVEHSMEIMGPRHTMEIMGPREFNLAKLGTIPGHSARILWREDGSMYKQEGIPYIQEADEILLPLDAQMPEVMEKDIIPQHRRWQRGCRPIAIREENKILQSRVHGNCVVIHGYMYPLTDFLRNL